MTIAVGMLVPGTTDFVIGADTQETYEAAKLDGQKIMSLSIVTTEQNPLGCVVFTGAGRAGYLDALGQAVLKTFLDHSDLVEHALQEKFERTVRVFHRHNMLPFGEGWARNESLYLQVLIAYQRGKSHGLFANDLMALRQTNCIAVGSGQVAALNYLNRFRQHAQSAEQALRLAAYSVYQAKEVDPYCGKQTHLVLISGNRQQIVDPAIVDTWEAIFKGIDIRTGGYQRQALGLGVPVTPTAGSAKPDFQPSGLSDTQRAE